MEKAFSSDRSIRAAITFGTIAIEMVLAASAVSAADPAGKKGVTMGFAVTYMYTAYYDGDGACPQGINERPDIAAVLKAKGITGDQAARILSPTNPTESGMQNQIMWWRGPNNVNLCRNPTAVSDPGFKLMGDVGFGLNLDGTDGKGAPAPNTCAHKKFTTPAGEIGIDNQLARVTGCISGWRPKGTVALGAANHYGAGEDTVLIEITGIDNEKNDGEIEVGFYSSKDRIRAGANGLPVYDATYEVHPDKQYHAKVRGRIVDGVITTEPADLRFDATTLTYSEGLTHWPNVFRQARVRLKIQPDGKLTGLMGAYHDWHVIYDEMTYYNWQSELQMQYQCTGLYNAFRHEADGIPDPKTGECTAISGAWDIVAVPAFILHGGTQQSSSR